MNKRLSALFVLSLALSLILSACGGAGAGADPVATVREAFRRLEAKQFDKLSELACAAQKDTFGQQFDPSASLGGGVDVQKILDAVTVKVANLDVNEVSRSGNEAVVHVKAQMQLSFDPAKFKEVLREMLKAQGLGDVDDATLDQFLGPAIEQASQTQDLDEDVEMVNENGQWLICSGLGGL